MSGDRRERGRNRRACRGDPDDVGLGEMRVVEQDRHHGGVRIAQEQEDLLAIMGAGEGLALAERQRPAGGSERPLGRQRLRELVGTERRR